MQPQDHVLNIELKAWGEIYIYSVCWMYKRVCVCTRACVCEHVLCMILLNYAWEALVWCLSSFHVVI